MLGGTVSSRHRTKECRTDVLLEVRQDVDVVTESGIGNQIPHDKINRSDLADGQFALVCRKRLEQVLDAGPQGR